MDFIDETGAEQGGIKFAAAFAEQALHAPLHAQPVQRCGEIEFLRATDFHLVRESAKRGQFLFADTSGGEHEDGREAVAENLRPLLETSKARGGDDETKNFCIDGWGVV